MKNGKMLIWKLRYWNKPEKQLEWKLCNAKQMGSSVKGESLSSVCSCLERVTQLQEVTSQGVRLDTLPLLNIRGYTNGSWKGDC